MHEPGSGHGRDHAAQGEVIRHAQTARYGQRDGIVRPLPGREPERVDRGVFNGRGEHVAPSPCGLARGDLAPGSGVRAEDDGAAAGHRAGEGAGDIGLVGSHDLRMIGPCVGDDADSGGNHVSFADVLEIGIDSHAFDDERAGVESVSLAQQPELLADGGRRTTPHGALGTVG